MGVGGIVWTNCLFQMEAAWGMSGGHIQLH